MQPTAEAAFRKAREQREAATKQQKAAAEAAQAEERSAIQALLPKVEQAATEALQRLEAAGWPDWQGGALRQIASRETAFIEERAVWLIASFGAHHYFLCSNGGIYVDDESDHLLPAIDWPGVQFVERILRLLKKIESEDTT